MCKMARRDCVLDWLRSREEPLREALERALGSELLLVSVSTIKLTHTQMSHALSHARTMGLSPRNMPPP